MGKNEHGAPSNCSLVVKVTGIEQARGCLRIALFDRKEHFLKTEKAVYLQVLEVNDTLSKELTIPNLHAGEYALAVFHDTNNNGQLNTNWLGIPTEPYGFSNDAGKKWRKPSFEDSRILLKEPEMVIELPLRSWKEY